MLQGKIDQRSHSNSPFGFEPTFVSEAVTTKAQALSTLSTGHYYLMSSAKQHIYDTVEGANAQAAQAQDLSQLRTSLGR